MPSNKSCFYRILRRGLMLGCTIAVLALIVFFTIMSIDASLNNKTTPGINFGSLMTIVLFSLTIAYARELFRVTSLPLAVRYTVNFVIVGIAYFFVILRSRQLAFTSAGAYLVGIVIYVLAYLLIIGIALLIRWLTPHKTATSTPSKANEEYTGRFS